MKHPALTRILSIILVLLCVSMAVAGGFGLTRADRDKRSSQEETARLRMLAEEYHTAAAALEGTESYESRSDALEEQQGRHEQDSSSHRIDLTNYTNMQYGLRIGTQAIDAAEQQFQDYKFMLEHSLAPFCEALDLVSAALSQMWSLYDTVDAALDNAGSRLAYAQSLTEALDSGEDLTVAQIVSAYDAILSSLDEASAIMNAMEELEPTLNAIAAYDPSGLADMASSMDQLSQSMDSFSDFQLDPELAEMMDDPIDIGELLEIKRQFTVTWEAYKQIKEEYGLSFQSMESAFQDTTGMTVDELRATIQASRDELAALETEELDPGTAAMIRLGYLANRDQVQSVLNDCSASLGMAREYSGQAYSLLCSAQNAVDGMNGLLARIRLMMAEAESALYAARVTIWWQMGQQSEVEEQLLEQREQLDREAEVLEAMSAEAEEQKNAEQHLRSLRAILLQNAAVRQGVEQGETPDSAAFSVAEETEASSEKAWSERRKACSLMLAGALFGMIGIPAAFEQIRSRFMLLVPVLLCLGSAASAETIFLRMGRGHSYSALAVIVFALLQLIVSAPVKGKKSSKGAHFRP